MQSGHGALRQWLSHISIGDTISVLAALEVFQDKVQLNVHKMRVIKDSGEEMLQFQSCLLAQRVYFEPTQPFMRRLFDKDKGEL